MKLLAAITVVAAGQLPTAPSSGPPTTPSSGLPTAPIPGLPTAAFAEGRRGHGDQAPGSAPALDVDVARSQLVAKLKKGGMLRFLGHEHGVLAAAWGAEVFFDEDNLTGSRIALEVVVADLVIDSPEARAAAGVDPDGPGEEEVGQIRAKMLSAEQLDAAEFPAISFVSTRLEIAGDELRITGDLTLHGVTRQIDVEAELERNDLAYVVRGAFPIRHREFGMEPVSIGGLVRVADEIDIMFEIRATPRR